MRKDSELPQLTRDQKISQAIERLLARNSLKTDGRLTNGNLALEAGVSQATLYRSESLMAEWRRRRELQLEENASAECNEECTSQRSEQRVRITHLKQENEMLRRQLAAAATVIYELSLAADEFEGAHIYPMKFRRQ